MAPKTYQNINTYRTPPASTPEYTNRMVERGGQMATPLQARNRVNSKPEQYDKILIIPHLFVCSDISLHECRKGTECQGHIDTRTCPVSYSRRMNYRLLNNVRIILYILVINIRHIPYKTLRGCV